MCGCPELPAACVPPVAVGTSGSAHPGGCGGVVALVKVKPVKVLIPLRGRPCLQRPFLGTCLSDLDAIVGPPEPPTF